MYSNSISPQSRGGLYICGILLLIILVTPIWRIDLTAPQYPEGLTLLIYAYKLAGNVDIINGLNHYIGMKTLHSNDFIEFRILPGVILFFAVSLIITAITAKRKWMNVLFFLFVLCGIVAIIDFWKWEYDYGHHLSPNAAIVVPGMAYQPPLIGFKQLLNFEAYSMPDTGGWVFIGVGIILMYLVIYEAKKIKSVKANANRTLPATVILWMICFTACSTTPQPIRFTQDNCDFCKMTISDNRFGAEIITKKGKVFKFDDTHCMQAFLRSKKTMMQEIAGIYFINFSTPHQLIPVEQAFFLQSPALKSPMNGNIAAFAQEDSLDQALPNYYGNKITWEDIQK